MALCLASSAAAQPPDPAAAAARAPVEKLVGGTWQAQGPGPNLSGQVENIVPDNEVVGAIHTVVAHPTNANVLYAGAVNGGVWKTTNAYATRPHWVRLTDFESSLSTGALAFDSLDGSHQTLVVGIGNFSSYFFDGGPRDGLLRTTNGGTSWTALDGAGALQGLNVSGLAVRGQTIVLSVHDLEFSSDTGIFRSTNGGATFAAVSGAPGTGLPPGRTHDLVADPTLGSRLFTTVADHGIFRSTDTGATWTDVSDSTVASAFSGFVTNAELAVGRHGNVFVAVAPGGRLQHVFRSGNLGASWTEMSLPGTLENGSFVGVHPGQQARWHMSIAADPTNPSIVYVGGDRQDDPFPTSIGAWDYSGRLFRGDASQPPASQWVHLTHSSSLGAPGGGTASSSAPHADSREMAFDAAGNLIETDDGGIYRRTQPRSANGDWFSINGDIQTTEFHDAAYDRVSGVALGGAQDTGTPFQELPDFPPWVSFSTADGGDVVAAELAPNLSLRYSSWQNLGGFLRSLWNQDNQVVAIEPPALTPIGGSPSVNGQFTTPLAINNVDPQRLVIGANSGVFESLDQGDTVRRVGTQIVNAVGVGPIAYGASDNPEVLYVGSGSSVYVRTAAYPGAPSLSSTFAGSLVAVDVDPGDSTAAYLATDSAVYRTSNAGASWIPISGDLFAIAPAPLRSLVFLAGSTESGVAVGTNDGVYVAFSTSGFTDWDRLGSGLPAVPVFDLDYDSADNVLVAGTLGRGAWKLSAVLEQDDVPPVASFTFDCSGLTCAFDASSSSDNVGIVSYSWTFGDGGTGSGVTPQHTYAASGSYFVTLTVADAAGNTDTASALVQLDDQPPVASFTFDCSGLTCAFDASSSSDNVGIVSYSWTFGDGGTGSGVTSQRTYAAPGFYTVTLTVADAAGNSDSTSSLVLADATPPTASFTFACNGLVCDFDGTASSDDVGIASYAWDFGDGSPAGSGATTQHVYAVPGVYTATLTVVDVAGKSDSASQEVDLDEPPAACFEVTCTNLSCSFDASCSSDDLGIVSFAWTFGDGTTASGASAEHAYFQEGVYDVSLTVTDGEGQSDVETTPLELVDDEAFLLLHILCP